MKMKSGTASYAVFVDEKGNRFVLPSVYSSLDEGKSIDWHYCRSLCCALNVKEDDERLVVEVKEDGTRVFPHVKTTAHSRGFAHGGATVCLIGGPTFDEISKETEAA